MVFCTLFQIDRIAKIWIHDGSIRLWVGPATAVSGVCFFIPFYQKWRKHQCLCWREMFGNVLLLNEWIHVWHLDLHHHVISPPICLSSYTHGEFLNSMTDRQRHWDSCKYFELIEIWYLYWILLDRPYPQTRNLNLPNVCLCYNCQ